MKEEFKELLKWSKENKGKLLMAVGSAFYVNDILYPVIDIGMIITGLSIEVKKHKSKQRRTNYE